MRTRTLAVLVVVLVGLLATSAWAQFPDARVMGMGNARVGVANGASAFADNPAGLPFVNTFGMDLSLWPVNASANMMVNSDDDSFSLLGSAHNPERTMGAGAGFWRMDSGNWEITNLGVGVGAELGAAGLTGGLSVVYQDRDYSGPPPTPTDVDDESATVNIGLMKRFEGPLNAWRFGLLLNDVTDEAPGDITIDLGASVQLPVGVLVAADLVDITDEFDTDLNVGAEWLVPMTDITVRAGFSDDDLTLGAGYTWMNWQVNGAWMDSDSDDEAVVGVVGCF
ncbi:MAG: hypothetical protein AB7Y46_14160 [Armatimonadota bacterium]